MGAINRFGLFQKDLIMIIFRKLLQLIHNHLLLQLKLLPLYCEMNMQKYVQRVILFYISVKLFQCFTMKKKNNNERSMVFDRYVI